LPRSRVTDSSRAMLALAQGDARTALTVAEELLAGPVPTHRSRVSMLLVKACALQRLAQPTAARHVFDEVLLTARGVGQRRPFHLVPGHDLYGLATTAELTEVRPDLVRPAAPATGPGPTTAFVALSHREREVLNALSRHEGPTGIS